MGIRNSWLDVVKKAFGSPTKPPTRIRSDHHHHEEDQGSDQVQKSRVKQQQQQQRRWSFKKQAAASITTIQIQILHHHESNNPLISSTCTTKTHDDDATTTALAPSYTHEEIHKQAAALVIQASFRGYLARRALEALKGVVKLQALIRGENVRKMTLLKCMHSLLRLQARLSDQPILNYNAYTIIDQEADNTQAAACLFQVAPKKDAPSSSSVIHQQFCGSNENQHLEQQDYWDQKDTTCSSFSPSSYQRRPHNQTSYYQHQQPRFDNSNPPFSSPLLLHKSRIQLSSACSSSPRQAERNLSAGGVNGTRTSRRYMCATASAMARQRTLSTTEGDKKPSAVRKRLSFKHNYINISDSEVDLRSPQRRLSMSSSSSSYSCCCKQRSEDEIDFCQIYGDQRDIKVRRW